MRFTPATFMASGGECVRAIANGGVSGSFSSGSRDFIYHEFKLTNQLISEGFQLEVTRGYTADARVIVIGGGGGGGWYNSLSYGLGGGGGGGNVLDSHNVILYPGIFNVYVGKGGTPADADNSNPALRTYNGGNGEYSRFWRNSFDIQANGGEGGIGLFTDPDYLHGGSSGAGFAGGVNQGNYAGGGGGCTSTGSNGVDGTTDKGGNGGFGKTITLPYTSPTWGSTSNAVGGGGGGGIDEGISAGTEGFGRDGGGRGSVAGRKAGQDADRYTGGGGGGGASGAYTPPNGLGTQGGDGLVIVYYPVTDCNPFLGEGSFELANSLYTACTSPTTTTLYYDKLQFTNLQVGSTLYYDKLFDYPVSNSWIISGSDVYVITGSDGTVNYKTICSSKISLISGSDSGSACFETTSNNYYYTGSFGTGTTLYTDYGRTSTVPDKWYRETSSYQNNVFETTNGVVGTSDTCPIECKHITFYGGNSGGTVSYYGCLNYPNTATLNRLNVFNTCYNSLRQVTATGTVYYTTGSAC